MKIEQLKYYKAKVNYHRVDDLKPDSLPNGSEIIVQALWRAGEDEKYPGDWVFSSDGYNYPARDLMIISNVSKTKSTV